MARGGASRGVSWFKFSTADLDSPLDLNVHTCSVNYWEPQNDYDTDLAIFAGSCGNLSTLACNDDIGCGVSCYAEPHQPGCTRRIEARVFSPRLYCM